MACPSAQNFPNVCCFPPLKSCVVRRLHRYVKSIKRGDGGAYFKVEDTDGDTYQRSGLFTYKVRAGVGRNDRDHERGASSFDNHDEWPSGAALSRKGQLASLRNRE